MVLDGISLYDHVTSNNTTITNLKLRVNITVVKQAYEEYHLTELIWTLGKHQLADCLIKHQRQRAELLKSNIVEGELLYDLDASEFKSRTSHAMLD